MDFLEDFKKIKNELEEVYTAEEWHNGNPFDDNELYIIHCEYGHHDKPTIHYNLNYGGNEEFNNLLKKYNLLMEWENPAIVSLYSKNGVKNSVAVFLKGEHKERYLKNNSFDSVNIEDYL